MHPDVVVVGSLNVDLVLTVARHPRPGETLLGGSGDLFAGGKGANQAVAAARLGVRTAMVGAVGTDANAAVALRELRRAGVDVTAVTTVPGPTGLAVVTLAEDGENTIVVVPGANAAVGLQEVAAAAPVITGATVCVLQAEIPLPSVDLAAGLAAAAGVRVLLNVAPACPVPLSTLALADPLVVNEHEATLLLGWLDAGPHDPPDGGRAADDATTAGIAAARGLRNLGVPSVVVTLGRAGVVGAGPDGEWALPARPVTARDTTGAGDAFVGALAAHLARGEDLRDAATAATRVAAYAVQRLGAQASYPWADDPLP
ncbi:ribokinase [Actinotalea sp.]|uniref:ribokinase n=1 Tax=Actinotalea sp. TaxID=1872145 RepID=UPI002C4FE194|nr:ribokinase [Actinotalea sp.]HQY33192.1 ribokinase [Actinotalea sp.]HRA49842.1 ribokinase [Actinotalea sp.]